MFTFARNRVASLLPDDVSTTQEVVCVFERVYIRGLVALWLPVGTGKTGHLYGGNVRFT